MMMPGTQAAETRAATWGDYADKYDKSYEGDVVHIRSALFRQVTSVHSAVVCNVCNTTCVTHVTC